MQSSLLKVCAVLIVGASTAYAGNEEGMIVVRASHYRRLHRLVAQELALPSPVPPGLIALDYDGDGCTDLAAAAPAGSGISLFHNTCAGGFGPPVIEPVPIPGTVLAGSADLTGDGCEDLLLKKGGTVVVGFSSCEPPFEFVPQTELGGVQFPNFELRGFRLMDAARDELIASDPTRGDWTHTVEDDEAVRRFRSVMPMDRADWLLGAGDFDGDGREEIAVGGDNGYFWLFAPSGDQEAERWSTSFPEKQSYPVRAIVDLNGDGRSDLLACSQKFAGCWVGESNGKTGLEQPIVVPEQLKDERRSILVGDFLGDGGQQLLSCDGTSCLLIRAEPGPPMPGVTISLRGGVSGETDREGIYRVEMPPAQHSVFSMDASRDGTSFVRSSLTVHRRGRRRIALRVIGTESSELEARRGQRFGMFEALPGPYVCLGYSPLRIAGLMKWGAVVERCPEDHAFYAMDDRNPGRSNGKTFRFGGWCCPLPAADILMKAETEAPEACPDQHVAIGAISRNNGTDALICAGINTTRYALRAPRPGVYFGSGLSMRWQGRQVSRSALPPAIRYGIGRVLSERWDVDGCVGDPPGALFVGVAGGGSCAKTRFSVLEYVGLPDGPPRGTPVEMYPRCRAIDDPFDPRAGCVE